MRGPGEALPTRRFSSRADPSEYTAPTRVEAEADVLHMWQLPDFGEEDGVASNSKVATPGPQPRVPRPPPRAPTPQPYTPWRAALRICPKALSAPG